MAVLLSREDDDMHFELIREVPIERISVLFISRAANFKLISTYYTIRVGILLTATFS